MTTMVGSFSKQTFVFDPRPNYPLLVTANRYVDLSSPYANDPEAFTLVGSHATGFTKEQWEPAFEDLQELVRKSSVKVREYWSIEAPNHGDSAILNEKILETYVPVFGWDEYARSIHLLISGYGTGVDTDFSKHRLIGVGHSMGAVGLLLSTTHYPQIKFEAMIFCDLMCMGQAWVGAAKAFLGGGAEKRRDIWPSKEEAYTIMKARGIWKNWDDRMLRNFVDSAMRPLPTLAYPDKEGVTLKCTRVQEVACYTDPLGPGRAYDLLPTFVRQTPTHLIYGAIDDYLPADLKEDILRSVGGVDQLGSWSRVPNAGHLIPQMNPKGLAEKIFAALVLIQVGKAKL